MTKTNYKIHSIKYNFIMNSILRLSTILFPMITFPYTVRVLGVEAYGKVGFVASIISYFSMLSSLGIPSYAVRKCAQNRDNEYELAKNVKEILIINLISTLVSFSIFLYVITNIERFNNYKNLLIINSATIILQTIGIEWFYQSIEQYDYITIRNIVFKIVSIILLFLAVKSEKDTVLYCLITMLGCVGSNILNVVRLPRMINLRIKQKLEFRHHIKPIMVLFFYYAATTIYTNLDSAMLGFMTNDYNVGIYDSSVKIKSLIVNLITALGSVALPRAAFYLSNQKEEEFKDLIMKSFNFVFLMSISIALYVVIEAKPLILFIAGERYKDAILATKLITPSIIFIGIGSITAWQLLIPLKREKWTLYGAIVGAIVDTLINYKLIPLYGVAGASIGTLCAEISVVMIHLIGLRDIIFQYIDIKNITKIIIGSIMSFVLLYFVDFYRITNNSFIICVLSSFLYFAAFCSIELLLRENFIYKYLNQIISKIKEYV